MIYIWKLKCGMGECVVKVRYAYLLVLLFYLSSPLLGDIYLLLGNV